MTGDSVDLWIFQCFEPDLIADKIVFEFADLIMIAESAAGRKKYEADDNLMDLHC